MVQLFSIIWGMLNGYLLFTLDRPSQEISLKDVNKFFTMTAIKYMLLIIVMFFAIFEAAGYLLCYAYLTFNSAIKIVFWISVGISSITIFIILLAIIIVMNEYIKKENNMEEIDDDDDEPSTEKHNILNFITKFNLILLIILSILLFRLHL